MKTILMCLLLGIYFSSTARSVDDIIQQKTLSKNEYRLKTGLVKAIVIPMSYGDHEVISEMDKALLRKVDVIKIDLVYTDFPKGQDLSELNKQRILKIAAIRKTLISDEFIPWNIIKQTACTNEEEARVLFHGIVVHYKPEQDLETMKRDISTISELPETGEGLSKLVAKGRPYGLTIRDSSLIKIMERNKHWKNTIVVADMTGSMSPYATQLLIWFQLKMKDDRVKKVVFFNDGDMKAQADKKIGSTGGIYIANSTKYEDILAAAQSTIKNGNGGDGPENNCEATIKAIELYPEASSIIMVADNFAPIKDISIMESIKKPVHIVLCGAEFGPTVIDYLNLARKTGGSVHTMLEDIETLAKLNEGEVVKVNGQTYRLLKGSFVRETTL